MATTKTLEQQITEAQEKLALLQSKKNQASNAQKIVIGGMMIAKAKKNPIFAQQLLKDINEFVTRDTDKNRLTSVIDELKEVISNAKSPTTTAKDTPVSEVTPAPSANNQQQPAQQPQQAMPQGTNPNPQAQRPQPQQTSPQAHQMPQGANTNPQANRPA